MRPSRPPAPRPLHDVTVFVYRQGGARSGARTFDVNVVAASGPKAGALLETVSVTGQRDAITAAKTIARRLIVQGHARADVQNDEGDEIASYRRKVPRKGAARRRASHANPPARAALAPEFQAQLGALDAGPKVHSLTLLGQVPRERAVPVALALGRLARDTAERAGALSDDRLDMVLASLERFVQGAARVDVERELRRLRVTTNAPRYSNADPLSDLRMRTHDALTHLVGVFLQTARADQARRLRNELVWLRLATVSLLEATGELAGPADARAAQEIARALRAGVATRTSERAPRGVRLRHAHGGFVELPAAGGYVVATDRRDPRVMLVHVTRDSAHATTIEQLWGDFYDRLRVRVVTQVRPSSSRRYLVYNTEGTLLQPLP